MQMIGQIELEANKLMANDLTFMADILYSGGF